MTLHTLYNLAHIFSSYTQINHIARIDDNIINMRLDTTHFCINLNKSNPHIYLHDKPLKAKQYNAPFDIALHKYFYKSKIISCKLDSMNKILIFECSVKKSYKEEISFLHLEFINRATNAIIVSNNIIISALHFSPQNIESNRTIAPKATFMPLPQPSFKKELVLEDKEAFLDSIKQAYTQMQNKAILKERENLIQTLLNKRAKLEKIYNELLDINTLEEQREISIKLAEHILINLDSIKPYSEYVEIDSKSYTIPKEHKPQIAAQKLFKNAKKIKQKIQNLNLQKDNLESKITFINNQIAFAKTANLDDLAILKQKKRDRKKQAKKQYESFYIDGICISIGRNESENIKLLQAAKADFLWLHIKDIPSSHLIIHANAVDINIIEKAGILLARLCGIADSKVVIDYTKRRFVKMLHGANVVYSKEKSVHLRI